MSARILVVYATRKGSTAGIARAIGNELQSAGYDVDVTEMKRVTSIEGYGGLVIGAPFYMGKPIDVKKFVNKHRKRILSLPVAAFTVGISPVSEDPGDVKNCMKIFLAALDPLQPVSSIMFAGRLDPDKLSIFERKIWKMVKGPEGDFRDWDAISAWAGEVAVKLRI